MIIIKILGAPQNNIFLPFILFVSYYMFVNQIK